MRGAFGRQQAAPFVVLVQDWHEDLLSALDASEYTKVLAT
jgi:hypothetical protein